MTPPVASSSEWVEDKEAGLRSSPRQCLCGADSGSCMLGRCSKNHYSNCIWLAKNFTRVFNGKARTNFLSSPIVIDRHWPNHHSFHLFLFATPLSCRICTCSLITPWLVSLSLYSWGFPLLIIHICLLTSSLPWPFEVWLLETWNCPSVSSVTP